MNKETTNHAYVIIVEVATGFFYTTVFVGYLFIF